MRKVSAVLVNYKGGEIVRRALLSLASQSGPVEHVVYVENGSNTVLDRQVIDGRSSAPLCTPDLLARGIYPWTESIWALFGSRPPNHGIQWGADFEEAYCRSHSVTVVANSGNRGCQRGINQGVYWTPRDTDVLLMGSDTILFPDTVVKLQKSLDLHPRIGVVGAKLVQPRGPNRWFVTAGGYTEIPGREHIQGKEEETGPWNEYHEYKWCTFSVVLLRRELIDDIVTDTTPLMDEQLNFYSGDHDICRRGRARGWACLYSPEARAVHFDSTTTNLVRREIGPGEWERRVNSDRKYFHEKWVGKCEDLPFPILPPEILPPGQFRG